MLSQDGQNLPATIAWFADAGLQGLAWGKSEAILRSARWSCVLPREAHSALFLRYNVSDRRGASNPGAKRQQPQSEAPGANLMRTDQ